MGRAGPRVAHWSTWFLHRELHTRAQVAVFLSLLTGLLVHLHHELTDVSNGRSDQVMLPTGAISFFTHADASFGFIPYAQLLTLISSCNRQQLDCHVIFLLKHKLISSSLSSMWQLLLLIFFFTRAAAGSCTRNGSSNQLNFCMWAKRHAKVAISSMQAHASC
ncbi:hypothetical protein ACOSQ2_014819 [Xanthoceras sorbifolium]